MGPFTTSSESAHPMLHIREKALARLLAVVADVNPAFELVRITN
jgi:hypothetical protein